MRGVSVLLLVAIALCVGACAGEGPTGEELQEKFRRGASGEGQVTPGVDENANYPYRGEPSPASQR